LARLWFAGVLRRPEFRSFNVDRVAISAYPLREPFHKERPILATARLPDAPVVTGDRRILG
jgi:hypothetical protein